MTADELQAENDKLRAEVESYRQRELAYLRSELVAAREAAEHYRNEAFKNADNVRAVNSMAEETISRLKAQLELAERTKLNAIRSPARANT